MPDMVLVRNLIAARDENEHEVIQGALEELQEQYGWSHEETVAVWNFVIETRKDASISAVEIFVELLRAEDLLK